MILKTNDIRSIYLIINKICQFHTFHISKNVINLQLPDEFHIITPSRIVPSDLFQFFFFFFFGSRPLTQSFSSIILKKMFVLNTAESVRRNWILKVHQYRIFVVVDTNQKCKSLFINICPLISTIILSSAVTNITVR